MSDRRVKFGFIPRDSIQARIDDESFNAYDIITTNDSYEQFVIDENLQIHKINSRVYLFDSVSQAITNLNRASDTYEGQIVAINIDGIYRGYIVNRVNLLYTVTPLSESAGVIDYNTLGNKPITMLPNESVLSEQPTGTYYVFGNYKIVASDPVFSADHPILCSVYAEAGSCLIKVIGKDIVDYLVMNGSYTTNQYATAQYIESNGYATKDWVHDQITALEIFTKDEAEQYIQQYLEANLEGKVLDIIGNNTATQSDINNLFN